MTQEWTSKERKKRKENEGIETPMKVNIKNISFYLYCFCQSNSFVAKP